MEWPALVAESCAGKKNEDWGERLTGSAKTLQRTVNGLSGREKESKLPGANVKQKQRKGINQKKVKKHKKDGTIPGIGPTAM